MTTEEQRSEAIRQFVRDHPGTSEGKVIQYMNEEQLSSRETTRAIIKTLVEKGEIELKKAKRKNNKTHHLTINDKHEFNLIDQQLSEIDTLMDDMDEYLAKISRKRPANENSHIRELNVQFLIHQQSIDTILGLLLVRTNDTIRSENDSHLFYTRIAKLMLRLNNLHILNSRKASDPKEVINLLKGFNRLSPETDSYAKMKGINTKFASTTMIENFAKRFHGIH